MHGVSLLVEAFTCLKRQRFPLWITSSHTSFTSLAGKSYRGLALILLFPTSPQANFESASLFRACAAERHVHPAARPRPTASAARDGDLRLPGALLLPASASACGRARLSGHDLRHVDSAGAHHANDARGRPLVHTPARGTEIILASPIGELYLDIGLHVQALRGITRFNRLVAHLVAGMCHPIFAQKPNLCDPNRHRWNTAKAPIAIRACRHKTPSALS